MAFSQLARLQMLHPMGMLGELEELEDILASTGAILDAATQSGQGAGAILDAATQSGQGAGAILDGNAAGQGEIANGDAHSEPVAEDDVSDDMSEPAENERAARQLQLDAASQEFSAAVCTAVYDEQGQELFTDNTWRPVMRPPTPPIPGVQCYELASGNSTPPPELTEADTPPLTPKRRRTVDEEAAAIQTTAALLPANDAAAIQTTAALPLADGELNDVAVEGEAILAPAAADLGTTPGKKPVMQAILKRSPSPRASPRAAATVDTAGPPPKAPPFCHKVSLPHQRSH